MIFDAHRLKLILDILVHSELDLISLKIELSKSDNNLILATNYGDFYYISCIINMSNEIDYIINDEYDNYDIVIPKEGIVKLYQMINFWPKSKIKIDQKNKLIYVDIVDHGQLVRERPVYVECLFEPSVDDYVMNVPKMKYNCVVNSKNLKQMLEFCSYANDGISIEIKDKSLSIMSYNSSLATLVELEEIVEKPNKKIKLSAEAIRLIVSFLNKLVNKFNLVYLLFIESESAFSIKINFDEITTIQIYAIHD